MSTKKDIAVSSVLKFFTDHGFPKSASSLQSEAKLSGQKHSALDLESLFSLSHPAKKAKTDSSDSDESSSSSESESSDSSSDSDSDSDSSSSSDSDSDSDSDSSSSDSDSSSSSSSSDSSDSSSSDSDSSDSSSSDSDSDSDSSDSDSDESVDINQKRMEDMKKKAEEAKKAAEEWAKNMASPSNVKSDKPKEPRKSGEAFRRVDAEVWNQEIIQGLEDNSYENTFGADGYGFKAHKVLSTVRGKDFRHEKTKRKRSTYRGGNISLESKSFKYEG